MEFESEEAAKAFYNCYARRVGFSTRVSMSRRSRRDGAIIQRSFVCAKQGFRVDKAKPSCDGDGGRVKRPRVETRVGCKAMLLVKIQEESGKWIVAGFIREHNHELVPPDKVHCLRSHRHFQGELVETLGFLATKVEDQELITMYQVSKFGESHKSYLALRYVDESAGDEEIYNVALDALREAANKVAIAKMNSDKLSIFNGPGDIQECAIHSSHANTRSQDHQLDPEKPLPLDEQDRKIQSLSRQLEHAEQKCEAYRANLLSILKDIEQQKLQLMVKVQNIKFGLKD
nr:protein FAR1-RELATED SEQUENCE 5-like [Ipomoea batatas]GMD84525.1 protein FAR1-RELATED SEQUENCE 5-like [Ipomoea batatas]